RSKPRRAGPTGRRVVGSWHHALPLRGALPYAARPMLAHAAHPATLLLAAAAMLAVPHPPLHATLRRAPTTKPATVALTAGADSLAARLRRDERIAIGPRAAGEAALELGRLHYARGEYRAAAEAFARAAARLDPAHKDEPLYWEGLAWLGLGNPAAARA